ncbi:MAG: tetratricopeptide repeat protein [Vicinamibacterales bacterium]
MSDAPVKCPNCGAKLREGHTRCPRCRAPLEPSVTPDNPQRSRRLLGLTAALVLLFAGVLLFVWYSGRSRESSPPAAASTPVADAAGAAPLEAEFLEWSPPAGSPGLEEEAEQLRAEVSANPKNSEALGRLGRTQLLAGRNSEAVAAFQAAVEADPQSWEDLFGLAHAQWRLGLQDECIGSLRQAQRLAPESVAVVHNLGVALPRRGHDDLAVGEFKKAAVLSEAEPGVRLGLAVSHDKLGNYAEAVAAYKAFLELEPASPRAERVKGRVAQLGG